jgi:carboxypeptidase Q
MTLSRQALCTVLLVLFCTLAAQPQDDTSAVDARILSEIAQHNELITNIEFLSDIIGARLTGSSQQRAASDWVEQQFRQYGLTNVHQEKWTVAHSWTRGNAEAQLIGPVSRRLTIVSAGWSPSTAGEVQGPVVYVSANSPAELDAYKARLVGAIVILEQPHTVVRPYQTGHPVIQFPILPPHREPSPNGVPTEPFSKVRTRFFKEQGVLALLRDSANPYNLMRMSNASAGDYEPGLIPTAFLSHEDYALLWRLLPRGEVRLKLSIDNSFSSEPAETSNTIAEIRGSEKPNEIVILGAHIDSWDLASGSTDNGTGVVTVLEAARALSKLHPKRTVRFVLFSGEEQGEVGSAKYVSQHKQEAPYISAVLVNDTGTGPILTIGVHENYSDIEAVHKILAPVASDLHLVEPKLSRTFGSDYAAFNEIGVPGFSCIGDAPDYDEMQHTQSDTFDKVSESGLMQSAQVMAVWAFNTAQYPTLLPRKADK